MFFMNNVQVLRISTLSVVFSPRFCRAAATAVTVLLAACATSPPSSPPPATLAAGQPREVVLRERAQGRWNALVRDDIDAAYAYMSPGSRNTISLDTFKRTARRGAYREAKIESVDCDGNACRVRLLVTYDHRLMKGITTPLTEAWVFDNGQAWYVYRE